MKSTITLSLFALSIVILGGCSTPPPIDLNDQPEDTVRSSESYQEPTVESEITNVMDEEIISQPDNELE